MRAAAGRREHRLASGGGPGWAVGLAVAAALALGVTAPPAAAQAPDWLFPARDLMPDLLAGSRDPVIKGEIGRSDPDPTAYGPGWAGEVAVGGTLPLARLAGRDATDALVLGMEGAAFARFSFEVVTRELVNTDWVFAVPLVLHRGEHWFRLRYYHTSSHLGDEYQRRFGQSSINMFRDGFDLTAYLRPALPAARRVGLGVYGVAFWVFNADPEETFWRGRAGIELDPGAGAPLSPFAALDVENEWGEGLSGPRWTAQAGVWLAGPRDRPLRLALQLTTGDSPMGQFLGAETRRLALGLYWDP